MILVCDMNCDMAKSQDMIEIWLKYDYNMFRPSPEMYHGEWHPWEKSWIDAMDENFANEYLKNYWTDLAVI